MKILVLLVLGVTLYAISGQQISDHQSKQMSLFNGIFNPYYTANPLVNWLSAPFYGWHRDNPLPIGEQSSLGRNRNQDGIIDLSSRNKQPMDDDPSARFFFNGNVGFAAPSVTNNFLIKTSYVFTTATGTVCKLSTCIPASLFSASNGVTLTNVICRKRREVLELFGEKVPIQPATVKPAITTTILDPDFKPVPEERQMMMSPYPVLLESSLDDASDPEATRTKRFAFVLTTTLTSYSLATTTYTITIRPASTSSLTCRPSAYAIC